MATRQIKVGKLTRSFSVEKSAINVEKRTVDLSFSSEDPYKRWFGIEILDHSKSSVDLSRLRAGNHPLLLGHDDGQQIGVIERAEVGADKKGRATVRFTSAGINPIADQTFKEIADGIKSLISVGYKVNKMEMVKVENPDDADSMATYRVTDWMPYEVSVVSIPADTTVGIGRSADDEGQTLTVEIPNMRTINRDHAAADGNGNTPPNGSAAVVDTKALEKARVIEFHAAAKRFEAKIPGIYAKAAEAVEKDWTVKQFSDWVFDELDKAPTNRLASAGQAMGDSRKTLGERFCESEAYKNAIKASGRRALRGISVDIQDRMDFRAGTPFSATTEGVGGTSGAAIQILPGVPGILNQQPLMVADLFAQGTTGGDTIRYIREDTFTNSAASVSEAGPKPEGILDVSIVNAPVGKIAVWLKITDEMLSDFSQMSSFINNRLGYMVQAKEEQELINGSGVAPIIKGVINFAGVQTVAVVGGAAVDAILKGISFVRGANGAGFSEPSAVIINSLNFMNLLLTRDQAGGAGTGQYLFGGPAFGPYGNGAYSNVARMWGLPVVATASMPAGTALAGDFRTAAQIFRRMGLTIESTNSNEDDFKNNLIMIRAEERLALAVYRPSAFCTITGL